MFEDPTAVKVAGGTGKTGWRVTGGGGSSSATATALLATGPTTGEAGVASDPFVVSANGSLAGAVTVTPSAVGGSGGTFSPPSQTITSGQAAQFTFTPNSVANYTISFTNSATLANPAPLSYASVSPAPPPIDIEQNWLVDVSPLRAWLSSQGVIPANCLLPTNKAGRSNKVRLQYEKCRDTSIASADAATGTTTASTWDGNGGTWLSRVVDPVNAARTVFKTRVNKAVANWVNSADRFRAEAMSTGNDRYEPWGGVQWCVGAIYLPAIWHQLEASSGNEWAIVMQWHDASGGLSGNPPIAVEWRSGAGVAANSRFRLNVRKYNNPNWPANQAPKITSQVVTQDFQGLTDDWVYLIWHMCTGNGYTDPVDGQIYGPVGAQRTAFVRLYAAFGEAGVPQIITDYQGFWGSPFPSSMALADKSYSGYWKTGLYSKTNFTAATTDNRETWNKGFTQWRAADIPSNVSAAQMLAAFKGLRD